MTKEFINSLKKVAPSLGMNLGNPKVITLPDNRPASYIQVISTISSVACFVLSIVSNEEFVFRNWMRLSR